MLNFFSLSIIYYWSWSSEAETISEELLQKDGKYKKKIDDLMDQIDQTKESFKKELEQINGGHDRQMKRLVKEKVLHYFHLFIFYSSIFVIFKMVITLFKIKRDFSKEKVIIFFPYLGYIFCLSCLLLFFQEFSPNFFALSKVILRIYFFFWLCDISSRNFFYF